MMQGVDRKKRIVFISLLISVFLNTSPSWAEAQGKLKEEIKWIKEHMVTREEFKLFVEMVNKRFEDMQRYMDKRFEEINRRFEDMNRRFEDMNRRFEDMNRRFEDLFNFMALGFTILGLIQGIVLAMISLSYIKVEQTPQCRQIKGGDKAGDPNPEVGNKKRAQRTKLKNRTEQKNRRKKSGVY